MNESITSSRTPFWQRNLHARRVCNKEHNMEPVTWRLISEPSTLLGFIEGNSLLCTMMYHVNHYAPPFGRIVFGTFSRHRTSRLAMENCKGGPQKTSSEVGWNKLHWFRGEITPVTEDETHLVAVPPASFGSRWIRVIHEENPIWSKYMAG